MSQKLFPWEEGSTGVLLSLAVIPGILWEGVVVLKGTRLSPNPYNSVRNATIALKFGVPILQCVLHLRKKFQRSTLICMKTEPKLLSWCGDTGNLWDPLKAESDGFLGSSWTCAGRRLNKTNYFFTRSNHVFIAQNVHNYTE